ncbi:MAG TPA: hypothetical protein VJA47_01730 [archaeon]|nr:hypothetical protein [archaeon]
MWKNILSQEQKVALDEACPKISAYVEEYLKPGPSRERGQYRMDGIRCAEELVRDGICVNDIKEGLKCYARWVSHKHLNAATEMVDIANANIRRW